MKLPTYKNLYKNIQRTPNARMQSRNFSLLNKPLILLAKSLEGNFYSSEG